MSSKTIHTVSTASQVPVSGYDLFQFHAITSVVCTFSQDQAADKRTQGG